MKVQLNYHDVEKLFEEHTHQTDVILGLYKLVFPDFDSIKKFNGFPTINEETNEKLFRLFMEFDRKHHPGVIAGGLWMNHGFSTLDADKYQLNNWEVETKTADPIYKMEV